MTYIYHLKPEPFIGNHLHPLNQMDKESLLYKSHAKKYVGREELMNETIPKLDCKWNDVVQFSALNPKIILQEIIKYNPDLKLLRKEFFKVHIDQIIGRYDAVVFHRSQSYEKEAFAISNEEISPFDSRYKETLKVPDATLDFWQKTRKNGGKFLWFAYIPHILVKGSLDTTGFEVIELE